VNEIEEIPSATQAPSSGSPWDSLVSAMVARAGRLTRAEAHAIAGAAAWQWQPLALPTRGGFAAARAEALAAARAAGRSSAAVIAMDGAASAALGSPGGRSIAARWGSAENGVAAVLIGVIGAIVTATNGLPAAAFAFGILAVVGAAVLLVYDSARVTRRRLETAAGSAALAIVVRDVASAESVQALTGPWTTVIHD
jgi:hypothetical protein